MQFSSDR